jgi:hypothetical protein
LEYGWKTIVAGSQKTVMKQRRGRGGTGRRKGLKILCCL